MPLKLNQPKTQKVLIETEQNIEKFEILDFYFSFGKKRLVVIYVGGYDDKNGNFIAEKNQRKIELTGDEFDAYVQSNLDAFNIVKERLYSKVQEVEGVEGVIE